MAQLPLVLIPAYFVPLFVMLHFATLFQAQRQAVAEHSAVLKTGVHTVDREFKSRPLRQS